VTEETSLIKAAGGLVWRQQPGAITIAVVHRTRYGDEWTLPKGKLDKGETWKKAAIREVCEEIGCEKDNLTIAAPAGQLSYTVKGKPKIVRFWNMILERDLKLGKTDVEVNEVQWLPVEKALNLLTHSKERNLLKKNKFFEEEIFNDRN
jgi:8-oxo-dGTP pyrophosphatase MutT (NUDIX family)